LGRLPGDIVIEKENFRFSFPWVTCPAVSGIPSLLLWLFRKQLISQHIPGCLPDHLLILIINFDIALPTPRESYS